MKLQLFIPDHSEKCFRCGHQWVPKKAGVPVKCPGCNSAYWARISETASAEKTKEWFKNASEKTDIAIMHLDENEFSDGLCEIAGYLHITRNGVRAVFDVGYECTLSAFEQNARSSKLLGMLQIAVTPEAYSHEKHVPCKHCGR